MVIKSAVKDFNFGLRGNAERGGRRREPHRLVKARFEFADWPVHNDHRRTFIHAQDTAKPLLKADDIAGAEPEWMLLGLPDDADKLGLVRVVELFPCAFAIRVHLAPPLMKLNCGCGLVRNARMSSASCGREFISSERLSPPAQRVSTSPKKKPALMGFTSPCCR